MRTLVLPFIVSVLTACGGGGGGSSQASTNPIVDTISYTLYETSYKNFKLYPIDSLILPATQNERFGVVFGNFLNKNTASVFTTTQNYKMDGTVSAAQSTQDQYKSDFQFWTINPDRTLTLSKTYKGCLHPRKAVVADFNKDGIADVFVACHGYDGAPYPGEKSKLLLSNGTDFTMSDVGDIGFYHSASAADINNDGYPDIVVADIQSTPSVYFLMNQGNGTFVKDTTKTTEPNPGGMFTVELIDVNQDNTLDLLIAGHEYQGFPTKILYGDATGIFGNTKTVLPIVPNSGIVVDFTFMNGKLYVDRVIDPTGGPSFYNGYTIQVVDMQTFISTVIDTKVGNWIPWFVPKTSGITPYTKGYGTFLLQ